MICILSSSQQIFIENLLLPRAQWERRQRMLTLKDIQQKTNKQENFRRYVLCKKIKIKQHNVMRESDRKQRTENQEAAFAQGVREGPPRRGRLS